MSEDATYCLIIVAAGPALGAIWALLEILWERRAKKIEDRLSRAGVDVLAVKNCHSRELFFLVMGMGMLCMLGACVAML